MRFTKLATMAAVTMSCMVLASGQASGLARWPDANINLPGNLANNIVQLDGDNIKGTATVLRQHDEPSGPGAWLCVLTADHVLRPNDNLRLRFNNGYTRNAGAPIMGSEWFKILAPTIDGLFVDIAVLSIYIPDRTNLPILEAVTLGGASIGDTLTLAGYGGTNITAQTGGQDPPGPPRAYQVKDEYGAFRTGTDTADITEFGFAWGPYSFESLQGKLSFTPADPVWPPTAGDAFVLNGDSGGPTFKGSTLVGIHSASEVFSDDFTNIDYVPEGYLWVDVDMGVQEYRDWVNGVCATVPEPSQLLVLAMGLAGLAANRLKIRR